MKVVINVCFGGFSLSEAGVRAYAKRKGWDVYVEQRGETGWMNSYWKVPLDHPDYVKMREMQDNWRKLTDEERPEANRLYEELEISNRPKDRADPDLVAVVEELGKVANGMCAELKVVEIPDGVEWEIDEYDGRETIDEVHRSWS